jgi:hypothetical protein
MIFPEPSGIDARQDACQVKWFLPCKATIWHCETEQPTSIEDLV